MWKGKILVALVLLMMAAGLASAADVKAEKAQTLPSIAVVDVMSGYYDSGKTRLLTDVVRSELFKSHLFLIVERGVIQKIVEEQKLRMTGLTVDADVLRLGKLLSIDKLFVSSIEKFSDTLAINVRIVDVETSLVDYTEIVFVKDENRIFEALREVVSRIVVFYSVQRRSGMNESLDVRQDNLKKKWVLLGAQPEDLTTVMAMNYDIDEYMEIRQYDITFSVAEFVRAKKTGMDMTAIRAFLQAGISYELTEKAISLGISKLDTYRQSFRPEGVSFEDYLDAYANKVVSYSEYQDYKEGYKKYRFLVGAGGVSDQIPIGNAQFKFMIANVGLEYFWTKYQRDWFKASSEVGAYLMWFVMPVPYTQVNAYFGGYPFYVRLSAGILADPLIGGHIALTGGIGVEVMEKYAFNFIVAAGSQPYVSYADLKTRPDGAGRWFTYDPNDFGQIRFPYFGVTFTYKM